MVILCNNVDFTTIIPTAANDEIDTKIIYGDKKVYAQRFTGSNISISANTRKDITLVSGVDSIIKAIGWVKPNTGSAKSPIGTAFVTGSGSSININGGHYVSAGADGTMAFRITFNSSASASYDIVVYYTKTS